MISQTIGFVGAGQMARALARGFVAAGLVAGRQIVVADPQPQAVEALIKSAEGAQRVHDNREVIQRADVVLLAVKPQEARKVAEELRGRIGPGKLLISIVGGLRLTTLAGLLATDRLARVAAQHALSRRL